MHFEPCLFVVSQVCRPLWAIICSQRDQSFFPWLAPRRHLPPRGGEIDRATSDSIIYFIRSLAFILRFSWSPRVAVAPHKGLFSPQSDCILTQAILQIDLLLACLSSPSPPLQYPPPPPPQILLKRTLPGFSGFPSSPSPSISPLPLSRSP